MPDPSAPVDEKLRARPARAQGPIVERDRGQSAARPQRMAEAHPPSMAALDGWALRAPGPHAALPAVHEHAGHARCRERLDRTIDRPALADRAGVDLDARPEKPHAALGFVEFHPLHPAAGVRRREFGRVGSASLPAEKSPGPHQRSRGDVEATPGLLPEAAGPHQQVADIGRDRHPAGRRRGVDSGQFARLAIDADPLLDRVYEIERRHGQFGIARHLAGVEGHLEPAGHRLAADNERMQVGLGHHRGANPRSKASWSRRKRASSLSNRSGEIT